MLFLTEKQSAALHRLVDVPPDRIVLRPVYPSPRNRPPPVGIVGADLGVPGAGAGNGGPAPAPAQSCVSRAVGSGGITLTRGVNVGAGVTQVDVSSVIERPFVVVHYFLAAISVDPNLVALSVKVASDSDGTGGQATAGQFIFDPFLGSSSSGVGAPQAPAQGFPNKKFTAPPYYMKFISRNGAAGNVFFQFSVSIWFLD